MMDITVHEFPPVIEMQASPFGLKLETWLKMQGLSYRVEWDPQKMGPKGKVPFATLDGTVIGDSELIIERLAKTSVAELAAMNRAEDLLVRRLVEEHLYFILVYSRWVDPDGWNEFRDLFFAPAPALIRGLIARKVRKSVVQNLMGQGIARHSPEEVYKKAKLDLEIAAVQLGDKPFFTGESPALVDASAYGLFANIYYSPVKGPLQDLLMSHDTLVSYVERLKKLYWPKSRRGGGDESGFKAEEKAILKAVVQEIA
ncbi:MAG: glutathione S-transferase family protein [Sneathiellales bacterium]|nr:glutathione S-transferase family protein [Sneathiellales bacterium]